MSQSSDKVAEGFARHVAALRKEHPAVRVAAGCYAMAHMEVFLRDNTFSTGSKYPSRTPAGHRVRALLPELRGDIAAALLELRKNDPTAPRPVDTKLD